MAVRSAIEDRPARAPRSSPGPRRLTRLLARLGPTFVKIGQFLALRPDLLPQEYCDELLRLVDRAPAEPWEAVRAVLASELGGDPERLFERVSPRPLAAGSIAQVHLARTRDGRRVAVKVQRPGLEERVRRDLRRVRWLARFMGAAGLLPAGTPAELTDELARWLHQELDFTRELQNHRRMHRLLAREPDVRVAEPLAELSRARVLTSEYLQGVLFSDVIRLLRRRPGAPAQIPGLDRDVLATRLIETALHQIFRQRFFHADLHPGNLLALPGNLVGLVDFGLCDVLDPAVEAAQAEYLSAVYNSDVPRMSRAVARLFEAGPATETEAFRREFIADTTRWLPRLEEEPSPGTMRSPTAGYMVSVMRLARRHGMRLPAAALSMYRTLLTSESVAHHLQSRANLRGVGRRFFAELGLTRALSGLEPERVGTWLLEVNDLARAGPGHLQQLLAEAADGRFILSVRTHESEPARAISNRRARLVALAVVSVGLALLIAGRVGSEAPAAGRVLWALLAGVYAWMALLWRRLR